MHRQAAMADAVIAIERDYEPFYVDLKSVPHGASAKAAAAQAAHDVLVALVKGAGFIFATSIVPE